ncbi:MAG: molybdate ABC transporter substrate-binding protein [Actinomycetota bacterium]|nr:molybdate ABC transporter substrate-binding protein [Actinomycetota bacterium]
MTVRPRRRLFRLTTALTALILSACSSATTATTATATTAAPAAPTAPSAPVTGPLNVYAAASLTGAFTTAKSTLTAANPGLRLTFNFAGSNALAAQIMQGAPADVFASADATNMQKLVDAGLVNAPVTFARNRLEMAVAHGNPKGITGLADLAKPGVSGVVEAAGVPAGDYTRQLLDAAHITVTPKSLETDVKSAIAKVASGEADATVVYVTDVTAAGSTVTGVVVPDANQPTITYPMAVVKATRSPGPAQAFVDSAVSGDVQRALEAAGFLPPQ